MISTMLKMIGAIYLVLLGINSIYGWDFDYIDINPEIGKIFKSVIPMRRVISIKFLIF